MRFLLADDETRDKLFNKHREKGKKFHRNSKELVLSEHIWGIPRRVLIPKNDSDELREIFIYNRDDSFALKMINDICNQLLGNEFEQNLFSYRDGFSTKDAVDNLIKNAKGMYGVKIDIKKYFNSVPIEIIEEKLKNIFNHEKDYNKMLEFFKDTRYIDIDGKIKNKYLSLKPGNAFSAFFSNYVLDNLDKYANKNFEFYSRYSDDILIFERTERKLINSLDKFKEHLSILNLEINDSKTKFYKPYEIIEYLGIKTDWDVKDISSNRFNNIKNLIRSECNKTRKLLKNGEITKDQALEYLVNWYNNKLFRQTLTTKQKYSWAVNVFNIITTVETLKEINRYFKSSVRICITGKNNKANFKKISDKDFKNKGYLNLIDMYYLFKKDAQLYNDVVSIACSKGVKRVEFS